MQVWHHEGRKYCSHTGGNNLHVVDGSQPEAVAEAHRTA
jgi:hypothetical protein